jgi:hypothetical protein
MHIRFWGVVAANPFSLVYLSNRHAMTEKPLGEGLPRKVKEISAIFLGSDGNNVIETGKGINFCPH